MICLGLFFNISESNEYGWWFSAENDTYDPLNPTNVSKGFDESLELVKSTFINQVMHHMSCAENIHYRVFLGIRNSH